MFPTQQTGARGGMGYRTAGWPCASQGSCHHQLSCRAAELMERGPGGANSSKVSWTWPLLPLSSEAASSSEGPLRSPGFPGTGCRRIRPVPNLRKITPGLKAGIRVKVGLTPHSHPRESASLHLGLEAQRLLCQAVDSFLSNAPQEVGKHRTEEVVWKEEATEKRLQSKKRTKER